MKEVLIEQKIALVGPLSEAAKLGSHGDLAATEPPFNSLPHWAGIDRSPLGTRLASAF